MNAVAWNQIDISDDTEEVVISSIVPSTIQLYRRVCYRGRYGWDGCTLNDNLSHFA